MSNNKRTIFLSNKDMLREIHNSKSTYCYCIDEYYLNYDKIVNSLDEINFDMIDEVISDKIKLLEKQQKKDKSIIISDLSYNDLVFRLMTDEHIPLSATNAKIKINFHPFKHYIIEDIIDNKFIFKEVSRSHWKNGFTNGYFSQDHGKITNNLAKMYMLLVDRYSQKLNWRGYSYLEEMKSESLVHLCYVGLKFNEAKSENPFAFYTQVMKNEFRSTLGYEKKQQSIRDEYLIMAGKNPSLSKQMEDE